MKIRPTGTAAVAAVLLSIMPAMAAQDRALDTAEIERLTGLHGSLDATSGVFKVSMPRSDLSITVAGVHLTPAMGLTAWAAFSPAGREVMVMGDMVLTENQVNRVMSAALDNGLEVTALHNHFLWDTPRVMFMHIGGMGDEARLAGAVGKVFAAIKETSAGAGGSALGGGDATPSADIDPGKTTLNPARIEAILGRPGELKDGVYKVVIGRATKMHGQDAGNAMGVNTWAAFAGADDRAVVDGDFAMLESELQGVLKALRTAGINIVAIHQHMTGESPRIMFLHFWGVGATDELARGLRAALDATGTAGSAGNSHHMNQQHM